MKFSVIFVCILSVLIGRNVLSQHSFKTCAFFPNDTEKFRVECFSPSEIKAMNMSGDTTDCWPIIENSSETDKVKFWKIDGCGPENFNELLILKEFVPPELREIDISNNSRELADVIFQFLYLVYDSLTRLVASHCDLVKIVQQTLVETKNLVEIDLSFNSISVIEPNAFNDLSQLRALNVSNNKIDTLNSSTFSRIKTLKTLDMSKNPTRIVPVDAFNQNGNLTMLRIENIGCAVFRFLHRSAAVIVEWTTVIVLNTNCGEYSPAIEVNDEEMVVRGPHKSEFHFGKRDLTHLETVTFGANQLKNTLKAINLLPSSLKSLEIIGNFVGEFKSNTFERFRQLVGLNLRATNLSIGDSNPFENFKNLRHLDISDNNLRTLNAKALSPTLNNLSSFAIANNNLGRENLHELLNHLGIAIQYLRLTGNYLGEIGASTFVKFTELVSIQMDHMNLQNFNINFFNHCYQLQELSISGNHLKRANFLWTSNEPSNLSELIVNGNNLNELIGLNNESYPMLKSLNVDGNPMSCEYVTELKENWTSLVVKSDQCDDKEANNDQKIATENDSVSKGSPPIVTIVIPICIILIVIVAIGVFWFVRRRRLHKNEVRLRVYFDKNENDDRPSQHIYEEIGPPVDPTYNHLNFHDLPPNNPVLVHYDNAQSNRNDTNEANDLNNEKNIDIDPSIVDLQYNYLEFGVPSPNNKVLDHYKVARPNEKGKIAEDEDNRENSDDEGNAESIISAESVDEDDVFDRFAKLIS